MNAQIFWPDFGVSYEDALAGIGRPVVDDEFEIGDVVAMRGQDQLMTVEGYCAECDSVDVVWFAGNDADGWTLHRDTFDGAMLVNLEDDT